MIDKKERATTTATPKNSYKDTKFLNQYNTVLRSFSISPKTMLQVSVETGILRANICRYVANMERVSKIYLFSKGICPISKHRAGFYTIYEKLNL